MITHDIRQIHSAAGTVVALGNFDGMHLGHQQLLKRTVELGHARGLQSVLFTFSPHPAVALGKPVRFIMSAQQRENIIEGLGVDWLYYGDFHRYREMSAHDFVKKVLVDTLEMKVAVMGFNNRFGKNGSGGVEEMQSLGRRYGFTVEVVHPVYVDDMLCSSSNIRALVSAGDVRAAARLLGRPFLIAGTVTLGNQLGRTMEFPTANLLPAHDALLPKNGVYVTTLCVDGACHAGITNVGSNPTVGNAHVTVETNILGFDENIYGKHIEVQFLDRLRGERRFPSLDALKEQLREDTAYRLAWDNTHCRRGK